MGAQIARQFAVATKFMRWGPNICGCSV